jgi:hypothetical protein
MTLRPKLLLCVCVAGIASLVFAASASAATYVVNDVGNGSDADPTNSVCETATDNGICTLRAALDQANNDTSSTDPDTITFQAGLGTILPTSTALVIEGPTTIDGNGSSGAGDTVISGNDANPVFNVSGFVAATATFQDLRIQDGLGAGITNGGSMNTVVDNSVVTSNSVTGGGAGAGINNQGSGALTVQNSSTISGNTITTGAGASGLGAGIFSNTGLTLTDSTVSGNSIDGTGQIGGDLAEGGALWINQNLTVLRSTISGNSVSGAGTAQGAGIFDANGPVEFTNSTISGNNNTGTGSAGGGGARLSPFGNPTTLTNVTFANNTANATAGPGADLDQEFGTATVQNTIFASPMACLDGDGGGTNAKILSATPGNNIDSGTSCGFGTSDGNQESTNPLLNALTVNAPGTTATHSLQATSPAVDMADAGCGGSLATDQRGVTRPQGTACDVGAYELRYWMLTAAKSGAGTGTVTATGINCGGDCTDSVREGKVIMLTATQAAGSAFASWSGCDSTSGGSGEICSVALAGDKTVTASFAVAPPPPPAATPGPTGQRAAALQKCKKKRKKQGWTKKRYNKCKKQANQLPV